MVQFPWWEMSVTLGKTPVSVLQELLSRRGTTPKYELVQIEGAIHEPTFRYRVTVSDVVAMGTGRSKKEAKHAAAKAILDKMIVSSQEEGGGIIGSTNNIPDVKSEIVSPYDDKIPGNPIGMLQEICMSRRWPPPSYDLTSEEVAAPRATLHHPVHCIQTKGDCPFPHFSGCPTSDSSPSSALYSNKRRLWKDDVMLVRMAGTGKSKKLAKRQAANKMWEKLQDAQNVSSSVSPGLEDDDEISNSVPNVAARYADLKDSKISTLSTNHSHKVSQFHKNLKGSSGPKLSDLQISNSVPNVAARYADLKDSKISTLSTNHSHKVSQFHKNLKGSSGPKLSDLQISNSVPNVAARYADLKDSKISTLSTNHSHKVSQFHKNLKGSSGPKLSDLQTTTLNNLDFNFVQFLNEIASEQLFEVTYVDIEEKSINGKAQCLVQLSTLPVAVCYGCGISSKEAQSSAAQNALEYLKIMTKK
uniref:DRBM domain-containing protein n=1 Tax=Timema cristinae TaxID=61476 RepID=A0A7R9GUS3_TIMCR|nr:unnamed protein product [Timema cristinae]